jgi:uncharacterized membrane protein
MLQMQRGGRQGRVSRWVVALLAVMMGTHLLIITVMGASWSFGGSWLMPVLMVALMALMMFSMHFRRRRDAPQGDSLETPPAILARRFAQGELTPQEYAQMERALREQAPPSQD